MASSVVIVLINLVALPFYLRFLGMEAYGLIGFYVTLQAVLQVLDLGLAPTVVREVAQGAESGARGRSASLLRTLGAVYVAIALAIAIAAWLVAPWIGSRWLKVEGLSVATVSQAITLMGVSLACRWPISLYHGALVGAQRLARSAMVSIVINISAACVTIAVLAWGIREISAFFAVQAAFGLLHTICLRHLALSAVGDRQAPYDFGDLRRVWGFSAWMTGVAIGGLLLTQIDKLVLSSVLSLESFGHYMLAVLMVGALQVLILPVSGALFPKFAALLAREDLAALEDLYLTGSRAFACVLFALAFVLALFSEHLLTVWLQDPALSASVAPLVVFMAGGMACIGMMHFPYALQLAAGHPRLAFAITLTLLTVMMPLVLLLAGRLGALGGSIAWLTLGVLYLLLGTWLTGRHVMRFAGWQWLRSSVAVPLLATLLPALIGAWLCRTLAVGPWAGVGVGAIAALTGVALGIYSSFAPHEFRRFCDMALGRNLAPD